MGFQARSYDGRCGHLTAQALIFTLRAYLTWGEGMKLVAQTFMTDVAKLSCCA